MCGRFASYKHHEKLNKIFDLKNKIENKLNSYNITPGQNINIILNYNYYNYILESNWGYSFVNKTTNQNQTVINSRIETINDKLLFKESFTKRKCIIPINGYYEWKNNGNQKIPYFIQLGDGELIYLAGIWRKELKGDKKVRVFSIITRHADSKIKHIHNRMPIILNSNEASEYMDKERSDQIINDKITSDGDIHLKFHEVSKYVNNPQNNDFKCIKPIN